MDGAMTEEQKKKLEQQLWNIANTLRGKMNADEFRDYILDFIFYKILVRTAVSISQRRLARGSVGICRHRRRHR